MASRTSFKVKDFLNFNPSSFFPNLVNIQNENGTFDINNLREIVNFYLEKHIQNNNISDLEDSIKRICTLYPDYIGTAEKVIQVYLGKEVSETLDGRLLLMLSELTDAAKKFQPKHEAKPPPTPPIPPAKTPSFTPPVASKRPLNLGPIIEQCHEAIFLFNKYDFAGALKAVCFQMTLPEGLDEKQCLRDFYMENFTRLASEHKEYPHRVAHLRSWEKSQRALIDIFIQLSFSLEGETPSEFKVRATRLHRSFEALLKAEPNCSHRIDLRRIYIELISSYAGPLSKDLILNLILTSPTGWSTSSISEPLGQDLRFFASGLTCPLPSLDSETAFLKLK